MPTKPERNSTPLGACTHSCCRSRYFIQPLLSSIPFRLYQNIWCSGPNAHLSSRNYANDQTLPNISRAHHTYVTRPLDYANITQYIGPAITDAHTSRHHTATQRRNNRKMKRGVRLSRKVVIRGQRRFERAGEPHVNFPHSQITLGKHHCRTRPPNRTRYKQCKHQRKYKNFWAIEPFAPMQLQPSPQPPIYTYICCLADWRLGQDRLKTLLDDSLPNHDTTASPMLWTANSDLHTRKYMYLSTSQLTVAYTTM